MHMVEAGFHYRKLCCADDKRKGANAAKLAEDSQSFAVESSLSSATTPRAHSFEAGDPPMGPEAGAPGKAGPVEKKGHSRSRSWVAAVTAPFSRSASGALRPSDEVRAACTFPVHPHMLLV